VFRGAWTRSVLLLDVQMKGEPGWANESQLRVRYGEAFWRVRLGGTGREFGAGVAYANRV
jgi:hypothetical protein